MTDSGNSRLEHPRPFTAEYILGLHDPRDFWDAVRTAWQEGNEAGTAYDGSTYKEGLKQFAEDSAKLIKGELAGKLSADVTATVRKLLGL